MRNIGVPLAHTIIAFKSLIKGFNKLMLNTQAIQNDLDNNWAVISEAIQTILRREGYPKPYETLKELTRKNKHISKESILEFIESLDIKDEIKTELRKITPNNYTGIF
jgi:adenylosuccinate lyase